MSSGIKRTAEMMDTIVLLDLNYTLVENSRETFDGYSCDVKNEEYRTWLIDLRPHTVILVTVRSRALQGLTMSSC